jgi:hypothetical protein
VYRSTDDKVDSAEDEDDRTYQQLAAPGGDVGDGGYRNEGGGWTPTCSPARHCGGTERVGKVVLSHGWWMMVSKRLALRIYVVGG